jgi:hypothetical protein
MDNAFFGGEGRSGVGLEFELRALHLAKQVLYCLSHTSSPFCSGNFGDGSFGNYLPGLASNQDPPDLLIAASQVVRITGVSYQHPAEVMHV